MKIATRIFAILKNKYLVSFIAFAVLILFFDRNDLFVQFDRTRQLKELTNSKKFYQAEIAKTKKELNDLQNNPTALEKYARENFLMKKDNEDLFVVERTIDSSISKK